LDEHHSGEEDQGKAGPKEGVLQVIEEEEEEAPPAAEPEHHREEEDQRVPGSVPALDEHRSTEEAQPALITITDLINMLKWERVSYLLNNNLSRQQLNVLGNNPDPGLDNYCRQIIGLKIKLIDRSWSIRDAVKEFICIKNNRKRQSYLESHAHKLTADDLDQIVLFLGPNNPISQFIEQELR
jgi:hypothetical protein